MLPLPCCAGSCMQIQECKRIRSAIVALSTMTMLELAGLLDVPWVSQTGRFK